MFDQYVNIWNNHLTKYSYSVTGGMSGGYYRQTVERCGNNKACICIENAESYNQKPKIDKYFVDESIMDDLERVVRKHYINCWNGRKFPHLFIHDGESKEYFFDFDKKSECVNKSL